MAVTPLRFPHHRSRMLNNDVLRRTRYIFDFAHTRMIGVLPPLSYYHPHPPATP